MYLINLFLKSRLEPSEKLATISSVLIAFWKGTEKLLATIFLYSEYSAKIAPHHVPLDLMEGEKMNPSFSLKYTIFSIKNMDRSNKCLSRETEKGTSTSWILTVISNTESTKLTTAEKAVSGQAQKCQYKKNTSILGSGGKGCLFYIHCLYFSIVYSVPHFSYHQQLLLLLFICHLPILYISFSLVNNKKPNCVINCKGLPSETVFACSQSGVPTVINYIPLWRTFS